MYDRKEKEIEAQAKAELAEEARREAIEKVKKRIIARRNRPWWRVVFPFRITITRI